MRIVGGDEERALAGEGRKLAVEQLGTLGVEGGEGLVENEQVGVVQERAAEREALHHPAREGGDTLVAGVPEAEAPEQHANPLAPLRHAVQATVEVEVLERCQVAVEQALVAEVADAPALGLDRERAARGERKPGTEAQQRRLPGAVRPADDEEAAARQVEIHTTEDTLRSVALLQPPRLDHARPPTCPQGIPRIPEDTVARELAQL